MSFHPNILKIFKNKKGSGKGPKISILNRWKLKFIQNLSDI